MTRAYGRPVFIENDRWSTLRPVQDYSEEFVRDLIFANPEVLPLEEIDNAFTPAIPICRELNTPAGPLDVLLMTPAGRLIVVETKLWRNPEARRKVVAQILDYAKELAEWDYSDLQREVNARLNESGNTPYRLATGASDEEADEAAFVDAVSRNLAHGRFLLLIAGDGIRAGAERIADFLTRAGHLEFQFALVELPVFGTDKSERLVVPRVIAKTVEMSRVVIEVPEGHTARVATPSSSAPSGRSDARDPFYHDFWSEFLERLTLDDPEQPISEPTVSTNQFFYVGTTNAWISAFIAKSTGGIGVYFRCSNNQAGKDIGERLREEQDEILKALGPEATWDSEDVTHGPAVRRRIDDPCAEENHEEMIEFFRHWVNEFVNVFRPRMKRISREIGFD